MTVNLAKHERTVATRGELVDLYRHSAKRYDRATRRYDRLRADAVELLDLRRGDTVLDVGCGTGLNLIELARRVGVRGRVFGVDASPQMLRLAVKRIERAGCRNVTLIDGLAEQVALGVVADAVLFSFAHDVLRSERAVVNVLRHARPGARIVSVGVKRAPSWKLPVNAYVGRFARRQTVDLSGFEAPWRLLAPRMLQFEIEDRALGGAYVAWGRTP